MTHYLFACTQRIFDFVGFKDRPSDPLLPSWDGMKKLMAEHLFQSGDGSHIHKSVGKKSPHGCVFTDLGSYVSSRYAGEHGDAYAEVSLRHEQTLERRIEQLSKYLPGLQEADIKNVFSVLDPMLLVLCLMGDGALLYKRQKAKCALSQAEVVYQVLREGVQSAHSQVPGLLWAGGDSLAEMILNCMGESEPLRKLLRPHLVHMPEKDTGPDTRKTKVVSIVGDAKWIWSLMGAIVNWIRPLLSGPFPREVLQKDVWIPAVYDRKFYQDIVKLEEDIVNGNVPVPEGLDRGIMQRQLHHFCKHDLGFNFKFIKYFAARYRIPYHVIQRTITHATHIYYLSLLGLVGRRLQSDRYILQPHQQRTLILIGSICLRL